MKKTSITLVVLILLCVILVSCSGSSTPNTNTDTHNTGLKFRVFVSNPLLPMSSTANTPVLNIVDASKDMLSNAVVTFTNGLTTEINNPGLMVESADRKFTLVYSASEHSFVIIYNQKESLSTGTGSTTLSSVLLPDSSESMLIGIHNDRAYAAVPNAPVPQQSPGAIVVADLGTNNIVATLPVVGVRYVIQSHDGNHILALSDNTNTITMISPSLIGTTTNPIVGTLNTGFDHPVWAIFSSDDSTAYVLNCGAECGGTQASVVVLDVTHATPSITATIPVPAATIGLLTGTTLYVAGTPLNYSCTPTGLPTMPCGVITKVNLGTQTVAATNITTDGYHTHMEMSTNGQIFIGSKGCTNIIPTASSVISLGCLSIFKPEVPWNLYMAPIGDVTGIQPISGRNVVYVCQNHHLWIYDTTTDLLLELQKPTGNSGIVGDAVDVKLIDF